MGEPQLVRRNSPSDIMFDRPVGRNRGHGVTCVPKTTSITADSVAIAGPVIKHRPGRQGWGGKLCSLGIYLSPFNLPNRKLI